MVFEDGETEKEIRIAIVTDCAQSPLHTIPFTAFDNQKLARNGSCSPLSESDVAIDGCCTALPEANENFCLSLSAPEGGASLGKVNMAVVTILNDGAIEETADLVAQMLTTRAAASGPRNGGWQQQFISALQCEGSIDHLGNHLPPSRTMMTLHFLSVFWKVLFATIPPARYCGGWLTFTVALVYIAILTAVIGDAAGQLGCAVRLNDLGANENEYMLRLCPVTLPVSVLRMQYSCLHWCS